MFYYYLNVLSDYGLHAVPYLMDIRGCKRTVSMSISEVSLIQGISNPYVCLAHNISESLEIYKHSGVVVSPLVFNTFYRESVSHRAPL